MTQQTDKVGRWEFPEDGITDVTVGVHRFMVRHTTLKRTSVEFRQQYIVDAFQLAAAWFKAHPNARPVTMRPDFGGKYGYLTGTGLTLHVDVSWVSDQDVVDEYGEDAS